MLVNLSQVHMFFIKWYEPRTSLFNPASIIVSGDILSGDILSWDILSGDFCPGTFYPGTFVQGHFVRNILSEYLRQVALIDYL